MRYVLVFFIALAVSLSAFAQPKPYHLELEANPAAPFPFLSKFGKVDIHIYAGGVRADTIWLDGFSRNGAQTLTVVNPLGRMYTEVPIRELSAIVAKMAGNSVAELRAAVPTPAAPAQGTVRGLAATRHRLQYGEQAWIDIWTTNAIPESPQLKAIVDQFVSSISPESAKAVRAIPGTPLYVELNFRRFKKVPLLRMKNLTFESADEASALKVGSVYFKAPLLDAIWK